LARKRRSQDASKPCRRKGIIAWWWCHRPFLGTDRFRVAQVESSDSYALESERQSPRKAPLAQNRGERVGYSVPHFTDRSVRVASGLLEHRHCVVPRCDGHFCDWHRCCPANRIQARKTTE